MNVLDERFTVFCREEASLEYCRSKNSRARFLLAHDMVMGADFSDFLRPFTDGTNLKQAAKNHQLLRGVMGSWSMYSRAISLIEKAIFQNDGSTVAWILRGDSEKASTIIANKKFDLSSFCGGNACCKGLDILICALFLSALNTFSVVVTDRLHVAICAAKLGKQVIMLDNSYGKLSAVYQHSLFSLDNVHLAKPDDLEKSINLALTKLDSATSTDFSLKFIPRTYDEFVYSFCSLETSDEFFDWR